MSEPVPPAVPATEPVAAPTPAPETPSSLPAGGWLRVTRLRVLTQTFFFLVFLAAIWLTSFGRLRGWPTSLFLEMDPLVGLTTLLTTGTLYRAMLWSILLFVLTLLLGRVFCNWVCPMGTLIQF